MKIISRLKDAVHVFLGCKNATDKRLESEIHFLYACARRAAQAQLHYILNQPPNKMPDTDHDLNIERIKKTRAYLTALPAVFVAIAASLDEARQNCQVGSAERKAFVDQIAALKAQQAELAALIGEVAGATDAADSADNALTPTPEPPADLPVETPPAEPEVPADPPAPPEDLVLEPEEPADILETGSPESFPLTDKDPV